MPRCNIEVGDVVIGVPDEHDNCHNAARHNEAGMLVDTSVIGKYFRVIAMGINEIGCVILHFRDDPDPRGWCSGCFRKLETGKIPSLTKELEDA